MDDTRSLRLFYHRPLLERARAGEHNFTNQVRAAVEPRGLSVSLHENDPIARLQSAEAPGYSLFHIDPPLGPRCLTSRLSYVYPFWRIEASSRRWEWEIARAAFDPAAVDPVAARAFRDRRRKRHLPGIAPDGDAIFVPLQGRVQEKRDFQSMSPTDMLRATLAMAPDRDVIATLHPRESYSDAEMTALGHIARANRNLTLTRAPMEDVLARAALVVTQNSSVALYGFLLDIPAILFARSDFHHVALNVHDLGVKDAFARLPDHRPDYAAFLYWFLKLTTIDAASNDAPARIGAILRHHGWEI